MKVAFKVLANGLGATEGPVAMPDGTVWVTSMRHGCLYNIDRDGRIVGKIETGGEPNGLTCDADGSLFIAQNGGASTGAAGCESGIQTVRSGRVEYILTGVEAPNDLCFGPDGRLYFTDPRHISDPLLPETALPGRLFSCDRDGSGLRLEHEGINFINGLAFDRAGKTLFLAETSKPHRIFAKKFAPDAASAPLDEFSRLDVGYPDGIAVASDGSVWVASTLSYGIHVFSPDGTLREKLSCGEEITTNLCFSVNDDHLLYVTCMSGKVMTFEVDVKGIPLGTSAGRT